MKYASILVMSMIMVVGIAMVGVVVVSVSNTPNSTLTITAILGFCSSIVVSLFTLIKTEQAKQIAGDNAERLVKAGEKVEQTANKVDEITNGKMKEAIATALKDCPVPTSKAEVESLIIKITERVCAENREFTQQQHLIKHAVANIANYLGLVGEVKRLGLMEDVDPKLTASLNPIKKD